MLANSLDDHIIILRTQHEKPADMSRDITSKRYHFTYDQKMFVFFSGVCVLFSRARIQFSKLFDAKHTISFRRPNIE